MNCLIIDDEPLARDIIENHVSRIDYLSIVAKCKNAMESIPYLISGKIDLLFLDIQMPELNGIDFIKSLKNPPKVIFTTAYPEYAIEGFNLEVVDYLLKPISYERFVKAIDKLKWQKPADLLKDHLIFLKSGRTSIRVEPDHILYIEGMENYLKIITNNEPKEIIVHSTFRNIEDKLLPHSYFIRVHKSFMINLKHLTVISAQQVIVKDKAIPLGNNYKEGFFQKVKLLHD